MKNITELLKEIGVEIPTDKQEGFNKAFIENYKTVNEVESIRNNLKTAEERIAQRDKDLKELQDKVKNSDEATSKLAELQKKYDDETVAHKQSLERQKYEFLVRESASGLKFSSNAAKKAFTDDLLAKNLAVESDKLLGFDDFVKAYKETDSSAFAEEQNAPRFSGKTGVNQSQGEDTPSFKNFW